MAFFSLLGALRSAAAGANVPAGVFADFRGLGIALAYPSTFEGIVKDMLVAFEERDPASGASWVAWRSGAGSGNRDGQMRLAGAGAADQHEVALVGQELTAGKVAH